MIDENVNKALRNLGTARQQVRAAASMLREAKGELATALGLNPDLVWTGAISFNYTGIQRYIRRNIK